MKEWRIAVVGSRHFGALERVRALGRSLGQIQSQRTIVVSGGAKGVDEVAIQEAKRLKLLTEVIPADWKKYGLAAGPIRNTELVARVDRVCVFWDGQSRGTKDVMEKALAAGKCRSYQRPDGCVVFLEMD
jgi:hypothetical protein